MTIEQMLWLSLLTYMAVGIGVAVYVYRKHHTFWKLTKEQNDAYFALARVLVVSLLSVEWGIWLLFL